MDALKLIPQLYYDLIARVLPGAMMLILLAASTDLTRGKLASDFWGSLIVVQGSALSLGFGFIAAAYLAGQIISPISDFIEDNVVKRLFPVHFQVLKISLLNKSAYPPDMRKMWLQGLGIEKEEDVSQITPLQYERMVYVWYDWLRINFPDVGANAVKIRAECRMHSQNAVVCAITLMVHLWWGCTQQGQIKYELIGIAAIAGFLSLWACARTYRIFQLAVIQPFCAVKMGK